MTALSRLTHDRLPRRSETKRQTRAHGSELNDRSTVHVQAGAGHELRFVGCEKQGGVRSSDFEAGETTAVFATDSAYIPRAAIDSTTQCVMPVTAPTWENQMTASNK